LSHPIYIKSILIILTQNKKDFNEFIKAIGVFHGNGEAKDQLEWMFDVYDLDCDGHIQYAELDKIIRVNNFFKFKIIFTIAITNCVLYHDRS